MLVGLIQLTGYDAWLVDVDVLRVIGINAAKSEGLLNECPTTPLSRLGTQTLRGRVFVYPVPFLPTSKAFRSWKRKSHLGVRFSASRVLLPRKIQKHASKQVIDKQHPPPKQPKQNRK